MADNDQDNESNDGDVIEDDFDFGTAKGSASEIEKLLKARKFSEVIELLMFL